MLHFLNNARVRQQRIETNTGIYDTNNGYLVIDFASQYLHPEIISYSWGVVFSPDSQWLAMESVSTGLLLFNIYTKEIKHAKLPNASFITFSFSPDGKWIVTGEDQGGVRLWQVDPLQQVAVLVYHKARVKRVTFSPNGKEIVSTSDDHTIALWDINKRRIITHIGTHTAPVLAVDFSPDGKQIVSGEHDKSVRLYTRHSILWGYRMDWLYGVY